MYIYFKITRASHSLTFLVGVVYTFKILKSFCNCLFLHCCQDCLKMKKSWKKRGSGCNSLDIKTMKILQNFRVTPPFPFES